MGYVRVKDFAKIRRGASPRPIADPKYFGGNVGWVRIVDVSNSKKYLRKTTQYVSVLGESLSVKVDKGDLIMSIAGTVGRPIIIDMPACIHDGFVHIYDLKNVENEYLYYYLKFIEDSIKGFGQSGTQVNLNTAIVGNLKIFLPIHKIEQTTITNILSVIDQAIEKTEQLITKYERIKTGLMQDLLTRGIDEQGNIRTEETHEFKDSVVGRIPKEWEVKKLDECSIIIMGQSPMGNTYNSEGKGVPLINGPVEFGEIYPTKIQWTTSPTKNCAPGDVLFCVRGSTTGKMNISNDLYCIGRGVAAIRGIPNISKTLFLEYQLISLAEEILSEARGSGSTFPSINSSRLKHTKIAIPTIKEQNEIIRLIENNREILLNTKNNLKKLYKIKTALMQDLLTGNVRVDSLMDNQIN